MSQRELAQSVGISVGGIHYALRALVDDGLIKMSNFTASDDKRRYAYILTPKGIAEKASLTADFVKRKMAEYEALREEIEKLRHEAEATRIPDCTGTSAFDAPSPNAPADARDPGRSGSRQARSGNPGPTESAALSAPLRDSAATPKRQIQARNKAPGSN